MAGEESRLVVAIRPRPLAPSDECDAGIRLDTDSVQLCGAGPGGSDSALLFDRVFTAAASNGDVYSGVALPVVRAALTGINGAVAAYGQTGSGKTRTMRGTAEDPGIVPRAVRDVFAHVADTPQRAFTVLFSYLEIYNEQLKDLLNPSAKLDVVEGLAGVDVRGCKPVEVTDVNEAMRLLAEGDSRRATAETAMNAASSRSHAIVRLTITSKPAHSELEGRGWVAVLSLVDLAGSETAKKTGASAGVRALEGANINKSLFALSRVIEALSSKESGLPKPPFRDSKLTHLLKPALERGAASLTAVVCAVHPAQAHASETASTLQFARRARCVVTRPVVTEELSAKDRARLLAAENDAMRQAMAQRQAADAEAAARAEATAAEEAEAAKAEVEAVAARLAVVEQEAAKAAAAWAREAAELRGRIARGNAALASKDALLLAAQDQPGAGGGAGAAPQDKRASRRATWAAEGQPSPQSAAAAAAASPARAQGAHPVPAAVLTAAALAMAALKASHAGEARGRRRAEAAAEALRQEVVALQSERTAWRSAADEAAAGAAAARQDVSAARAAAAFAEKAAADALVETAAWRDSAAKADARWLRAQHDVAAAEDRLQAVRGEAAKARHEADGAGTRAAVADSRAARCEIEAARSLEVARCAEADATAARGDAAAAAAAAAAATARAGHLAAAAAAHAQQAVGAPDTLAAAERRCVAAELAADLSGGEVARLRFELDAAKRDAWAAGERCAEAEADAARARASAAAASERCARAESDAQARMADVATALDCAAASRRSAHDAAADCEEARRAAAEAQGALAALAAQHCSARAALAAAEERCAALEADVAVLKEIEAAACEVMEQHEAAVAGRSEAEEALQAALLELTQESAARAAAEAQVDQLLEEGATAGQQALQELSCEIEALESRAEAAEERAAALAAAAAAAPASSGTPIPAAPPPAAAESGEEEAAEAGGRQRARATLEACKAVAASLVSSQSTTAAVPSAAAGGGAKPKCGVCPVASKARVGANPHPLFAHISVCKACFGPARLDGGAAWDAQAERGTAEGAAPLCGVCAGSEALTRCAAAGCAGAFCAACLSRHFPGEAPPVAGGAPWSCFLCRDDCAALRTARANAVFARAHAQTQPHTAPLDARPMPSADADKENVGVSGKTAAKTPAASARPRGAPGATKRRLGANRALEEDALL